MERTVLRLSVSRVRITMQLDAVLSSELESSTAPYVDLLITVEAGSAPTSIL